MRPQNVESRSDPTILFARWRKFLICIITNSTQLKNADSIVPPTKQYLYLSLVHKELNNQNRDFFDVFQWQS